jgi:fluoride exporter
VTQFLYVILGAAVGAPARYLLDRAVQSRHDAVMPWGTLTVNVVGSLVLGLMTGLVVHHVEPQGLMLTLGTGLCGALTTYSTMELRDATACTKTERVSSRCSTWP